MTQKKNTENPQNYAKIWKGNTPPRNQMLPLNLSNTWDQSDRHPNSNNQTTSWETKQNQNWSKSGRYTNSFYVAFFCLFIMTSSPTFCWNFFLFFSLCWEVNSAKKILSFLNQVLSPSPNIIPPFCCSLKNCQKIQWGNQIARHFTRRKCLKQCESSVKVELQCTDHVSTERYAVWTSISIPLKTSSLALSFYGAWGKQAVCQWDGNAQHSPGAAWAIASDHCLFWL